MAHPGNIRTTAGETFTFEESADMARMVFKRFGNDLGAATAAWNRLMQTNCDTHQFQKLLDHRPATCANPGCGCDGTCPLND